MRFYPALTILVAVTVAGWAVGMYVHAFILPKWGMTRSLP